MFQAAKAAEPLLSEADAGLATIEACKGNDLPAARYVRKSRQRARRRTRRRRPRTSYGPGRSSTSASAR